MYDDYEDFPQAELEAALDEAGFPYTMEPDHPWTRVDLPNGSYLLVGSSDGNGRLSEDGWGAADPLEEGTCMGDAGSGEDAESLIAFLQAAAAEAPRELPVHTGTVQGYGHTFYLAWSPAYGDAGDGLREVWGEGRPPATIDDQQVKINGIVRLRGAFDFLRSRTEIVFEGGEVDSREELAEACFFVRAVVDAEGHVEVYDDEDVSDLDLPDEDDEA